jgi:DNA invertase Pin-like site-specific DNA recombinase
MIRELKDLGVYVIFEEQNLNSQDEKCALALNIFAAIAEEESHSISQHAIQAHEQYALEADPSARFPTATRMAGITNGSSTRNKRLWYERPSRWQPREDHIRKSGRCSEMGERNGAKLG